MTVSGSPVTNDATSGANANADASISAQASALYIAGKRTLSSVILADAHLEVTGGTAQAGTATSTATTNANASAIANVTASGGGAYFGGDDSSITASLFQRNSILAKEGAANGRSASNTNSTYAIAPATVAATVTTTASGGGAYFNNGSSITASLFQGNNAQAEGGKGGEGEASTSKASTVTSAANANANVTTAASGGGAYFKVGDNFITASLFQENSAQAMGGVAKGKSAEASNSSATADAIATATASGGGAYFGGGNSIITASLFRENNAQATGGAAEGGHATAGGARSLAGATANATATASGGGVYFAGGGNIMNSLFQGNRAQATGKEATGGGANATKNDSAATADANATATASGGGVYFGSGGTITNSFFQGNSAQAEGGVRAQSGTTGTNDATKIHWANADATAFGGAVYFKGDTATIDGGSFIGNSVSAEATGEVSQGETTHATEAEAKGGALFVNTNATAATLTLKAVAGEILVSGNTANGKANGIHFGRAEGLYANTGYFSDSQAGTAFNVSATNHEIRLEDPVTVELYSSGGADFTMTVQEGQGRFFWGGKNVFDANGGASVTFANGSKTVFLDDFTLGATPNIDYRTGSPTNAYARASTTNPTTNTNALTVTLSDGADLAFSSTRAPTLALFDFTGSSKEDDGKFVVGSGGASLGLLYDRQLSSVAPGARYLVADGVTDSDRDTAIANLTLGTNIAEFKPESNQVWAVGAGYLSPYQPVIDDWKNTESAAPSLKELLCDCAVSQDEFDAIAHHLASATPDHVLNQASASLELTRRLLDAARNESFPDTEHARGSRLWGRTLNIFDRMDSHDRYRGYKQDANGFLLGLTRDTDSATAGAYVGYTRGETKTRLTTGEVESEGHHAGFLGRVSPLEDTPEFSLTGEAGFSHYTNKARRNVGLGKIRADFSQRLYSLGLGAEVGLESGSARLTPFARLRYTYLDQDGVTERGGLTRTRIGGLSGNSVTTELGARLSKTFATPRGTAIPYVSASWRHEYGDAGFSASARYALPDGHCLGALPEFRVGSVKRDRDTALLGTGIHASFGLAQGRRLGINADYKAALGKHGVSHGFSVLLKLAF